MVRPRNITGSDLKKWRESEKITHKQLEGITGIQAARLADMESGRIRMSGGPRIVAGLEQLLKQRGNSRRIPKGFMDHYIDCPPYNSRHRITLCISMKSDGAPRHLETCTKCSFFDAALKQFRGGKLKVRTLEKVIARD